MPRWFCAFPAPAIVALVVVTCFPAAIGWSAPRPLPELKPEERQLRELVQPLRDGLSEGPELQPLHDWLRTRESARKGREAERELRRVLHRIHSDFEKDLVHAAEWLRTLQNQRAKLYNEISETKTPLPRAIERSQELSPVPTEEEIWPGRTGFSDGFIAGDTGAVLSAHGPTGDAHEEQLSETEGEDTTDLDAQRILDRLTLDLTALQHLSHDCDDEYEREQKRHQSALENLTKFLQAHRAAARRAS